MALYHFTTKPFSRGTRNTVRAVAYRAGCKLYDERTGETFNYQSKAVQHVELLLPKDAPLWAQDVQNLIAEDRQKGVQAFVDIVEGAELRINSRVWREFEFALQRELTDEQNIALAREFIQDQICSRGMTAQLNFHFDVDEDTGEEKPHCHVLVTTRRLDETGMGLKEREWNKKDLLCDLREKWQEYSNFHLKLHGHDVQIDHRSNKERGVEMEPQPKRGKNAIEQEKRLQKLEGTESLSPITHKAKDFHDVRLRNLYRIMRHPEVVLDIVTKHHASFMWADVQKVLHRYVDEVPLFQRLEAKLKTSDELLTLRMDSEDKSIYTTRTMLKAERSLVEKAEMLGKSQTHPVKTNHIEVALTKANASLEKHGGLSQDQIRAIHHLVKEGQIKCVVGIAGAGKTTALGVCQEIWQNSGYAVYGLAPTGKAAQNLQDSGIVSMTIHKFLKSFEEGKCQYNEKSVLVLDEAGMVDVERFEKLLEAVQQLGVKLIVVGDGAQLQPVEAGPAFRLVTERLGKSELNTVLRQKEDWQKEATVLFGQQKTAEALQLYMDKGHVHLVEEIKEGKTIDIRVCAKDALIKAWNIDFKNFPEKNCIILAHTNKDVKDLNDRVRNLLKEAGQLSKKEFTFIIKKEEENDFGKRLTKQERKGFSQGDRIVFTRNNYGQGVKNGSMGTILKLNQQKIVVKLDNEQKELSFAPKLNTYFDQGWAITIHKSQGTTVDRSYVLASSSMTQNLSYVAMTRHKESVQLFGSANEFSSPAHFCKQLSKSGEKLSPGDYLDADSLNKLMKHEDRPLTQIFKRTSNELEAMGVVSKRAFWQVADHFLGTQTSQSIRINPQILETGLKEEARAEKLLQKKYTYEGIIKACERTLYDYLKSENRSLTPELKDRITLQSEKAATYLLHRHTLKDTEPSQHETKLYLLRAKYELDRIPEIRQEIIKDWDQEGHFDEKKDGLLAHIIAERRTSIEGRLYFEAKSAGKETSSKIPELAEKELAKHQAQIKKMAEKLMKEHSLSKTAALHCAKNILRYKETFGENPSNTQVSHIIKIQKVLEKIENTLHSNEFNRNEQAYLHRKESEFLFWKKAIGNSLDKSKELTLTENHIIKSLKMIKTQINCHVSCVYRKEHIL